MTQPTSDPQAEKNAPAVAHVDRRVLRSRRAIVEAFKRLLATTPIDRVTVSAIAREADVDRKTFYQHFGSVEGLLASISDSMAGELLDEVEQAMAEDDGRDGGSRALRVFFEALAARLSQDLLGEQRSCENVPPELLIDYLLRPLTRQIVERGLVYVTVSDEDLEMTLSFVLGGLLSLYRWWLQSDRSIPADEVIGRGSELLERGLVSVLVGAPAGESAGA